MMDLFDQAIRAGEAQREGSALDQRLLIPAMMGCRDCGTLAMISAPALGTCADCRRELEVMPAP